MADDSKHQRSITVRLTDREYIDLCMEADRSDRKAAELARAWVRERMYGTVRSSLPENNENSSCS